MSRPRWGQYTSANPRATRVTHAVITAISPTGPAIISRLVFFVARAARHTPAVVQSLCAPRPAGWESVWETSPSPRRISGVPTVGGRGHISLIRRDEGYGWCSLLRRAGGLK